MSNNTRPMIIFTIMIEVMVVLLNMLLKFILLKSNFGNVTEDEVPELARA